MKRPLIGVLAVLLAAGGARAADVYIGVEGPRGAKSEWVLGLGPVLPADPKSPQDTETGRKLRNVLRADLLFSRYFDLVERGPAADVKDPKERLEFWKRRGAVFLLEGTAGRKDGQVTLTARLIDLGSGETMLSRHYRQSGDYWRAVAHRASDDVVRQLTGRPGIAQSRIAFVNDQTGAKELYLIDYDGARLKRLTMNKSILLLPRWTPDGSGIVFTSYMNGNPDLFHYDLGRGRVKPLSERQGLNLAGGFSPDGARLAATISRGKNPNIFLIDMKTGKAKRAATRGGVESSPTFSPDGKHIAFVSDRAGNPQIYTMELATGHTRKLTRMNWCDSPAWSPTGEWIALAGRANPRDSFDIFLVDVAGTRIMQLTHGEGSNENPAWSPDGRFLAFTTTRDKKRRLYVMDADGSAPRAIADVRGDSFTPHWH